MAGLYATEHRRLIRTAFLLTGSRAAAEDLAQEAFVQVHRRLDAIERPGAYLQATLANLCKRYLRREEREAKVRSFLAAARHDRMEPTGDNIFDSLWGLSPAQRTVLVLRFYLDLPDAEISRVLACPEATVRSHASRGLEQLRKVVEQ
jgi:RNA polymerase sigma factor (sigma-70 family)